LKSDELPEKNKAVKCETLTPSWIRGAVVAARPKGEEKKKKRLTPCKDTKIQMIEYKKKKKAYYQALSLERGW